MATMRYEPWNLLTQLHNEVNRVFDTRLGRSGDDAGQVVSDWTPAVDIREDQHRYVILADVPGVDLKDIEITLENGTLTLRGDRRNGEQNGYKRAERPHGSFYRRFTLPDTVDTEGVSAKGLNGVLEISIPKAQKVQPRKIAVEG
jgi:HSP20 family protein